MKLIINADDCGKNQEVNSAIESFINAGKITSTTVMANMDDLQGAAKLYQKYGDKISFGIHLNLTEGHPLLNNDLLLSQGVYKESHDGIVFNVSEFRNHILLGKIREAIEKELDAQIVAVRDAGIKISHIDSHHHIHTSFALVSIIPGLAQKYGITKIRRMRNYVPGSSHLNVICRNLWLKIIKFMNSGLVSTDYFGIFDDWYYERIREGMQIPQESILELMCHPGGIYQNESNNLLSMDFKAMDDIKLVTYYEI